jgi:anti-sigma B factor antagonist
MMAVEVEQQGEIVHLKIVDEMTIYTASEHKESLRAQLLDSNDIEVDLAGVSELDSAGLQVLMMFKSECEKAKKEVRYIHHSTAVISVLELLNLDFGDPIILSKEWQSL